MTTLLNVLRAAALLGCIAVCICLSIFVIHLDQEVKGVKAAAASTQGKVNADLDEAHRLILEAGLTAMEARKASAEERAYLRTWNSELSTALSQTDALIGHLDESQKKISDAAVGTLSAASDTISDVQPVLAEVRTTAVTTNATVSDLDRFINSPDLAETQRNFAALTGNLALTSSDFQKKFHDLMYPPKCEGKWCWVKRTWVLVHAGSELAEPAYWLQQIVMSAR